MSTMPKRKRCRYCGELFTPDPRVKDQQIACIKASCRKARKKETQKDWLKKNPGYFKGRYPNTKKWLNKHPGYLRTYRQSHPEYVQKNRIKQKQRRKRAKISSVDIQDTINSQPITTQADRFKLAGVDIQDAISTQLIVPVYVKGVFGRVDIQDNIDRVAFREYPWIKYQGGTYGILELPLRGKEAGR